MGKRVQCTRAENDRCLKDNEPVHHPLIDERTGEPCAALDHQCTDSRSAERDERGVERFMNANVDACSLQRLATGVVSVSRHDRRRYDASAGDERGTEWRAELGIEDDTARRNARRRDVAHGQHRIVGEHRAHTNGNGVDAGAHAMHFAAGLRSGEPLPRAATVARFAGDPTIERGGELEDDPGTRGAIEERRVELPCRIALDADVHLDSGVAQSRRPASGHRIHVFARGDHA